jgi:hypothetical protein
MLIAKLAIGLFAVISAALSFLAARKGGQSSQIVPAQAWAIEPGEPLLAIQGWNAAILSAGAKSAHLNASAARLAIWAGVMSLIAAVVAIVA